MHIFSLSVRSYTYTSLNIQIPHIQGVGLNEALAGRHEVAHEHGEGLVGLLSILGVTWSTVRFSGFMVVSQSCSAFISPSPL
jgi:hypothetical protein